MGDVFLVDSSIDPPRGPQCAELLVHLYKQLQCEQQDHLSGSGPLSTVMHPVWSCCFLPTPDRVYVGTYLEALVQAKGRKVGLTLQFILEHHFQEGQGAGPGKGCLRSCGDQYWPS